jgi:hypothetical protein
MLSAAALEEERDNAASQSPQVEVIVIAGEGEKTRITSKVVEQLFLCTCKI